MNTFYRHFRKGVNELVKGKDITVCGVQTSKDKLLIGIAICNSEDQFVKKEGREVAFDNAHLNYLVELDLDGEYSGRVFHDFFNELMVYGPFKHVNQLKRIVEVTA